MTSTFEHGNVTLRVLVTGPVQENTLLLHDGDGQGFIIDPGDEAGRILAAIAQYGLRPSAILLTHAHFDHVGAVQEVREALGLPVHLHERDLGLYRLAASSAARWGVRVTQPADPDAFLTQGQEFVAGSVKLTVRELPGHAPGHVVFASDGYVVAGDTLFQGSIGRTDLPGADHEQLIEGITRELLSLPDDTRVYPGHGAPTTIGRERTHNPFL